MNKVILMGRLTKDPEIKKTTSDLSVCNFTIAVNRRFDREKADFINCIAWRQTAEFLQKYFRKGDMIAVVGELQTRQWQADDGTNRYATEVIVDEVNFCGGKSEKKEENNAAEPKLDDFVETDEDLPF